MLPYSLDNQLGKENVVEKPFSDFCQSIFGFLSCLVCIHSNLGRGGLVKFKFIPLQGKQVGNLIEIKLKKLPPSQGPVTLSLVNHQLSQQPAIGLCQAYAT